MRILMFGWEFPPQISGGLGTACHGLTQALGRVPSSVPSVTQNLSWNKAAKKIKNLYYELTTTNENRRAS